MCDACPAQFAVLQGAYGRYTNTLIVLERALWLANFTKRTLLVDTGAMFPNNSKITKKFAPNTRSLSDILQVEPFHDACIYIDDVQSFPDVYRAVRSAPGAPERADTSWHSTSTKLSKFEHDQARIAVLASGDSLFKHACTPGEFSHTFHRLFRFPKCVEEPSSAYAAAHFSGAPYIGLHLRADPSPTKQYDLRCHDKKPCDPASSACPADAFAAAAYGCNMTTFNVRAAASYLWGEQYGKQYGDEAPEFVAAPPDLWMEKESEARRLMGDRRVHFLPIAVTNASGWYELNRVNASESELPHSRRRQRLRKIELPEACRGRSYPIDALQLDQSLLASSDLFFGNWVSTFSSFVAKLRAARGKVMLTTLLYWPPLYGADLGVPRPGAPFWSSCNNAAPGRRCSHDGRASLPTGHGHHDKPLFDKPQCSGL